MKRRLQAFILWDASEKVWTVQFVFNFLILEICRYRIDNQGYYTCPCVPCSALDTWILIISKLESQTWRNLSYCIVIMIKHCMLLQLASQFSACLYGTQRTSQLRPHNNCQDNCHSMVDFMEDLMLYMDWREQLAIWERWSNKLAVINLK